jgi:hypothetical protein
MRIDPLGKGRTGGFVKECSEVPGTNGQGPEKEDLGELGTFLIGNLGIPVVGEQGKVASD